MAPAPAFMSMQILPPYAYPFGKTATIKMSVTLDGAPVKGVPVVWKGHGLVYNNTLTNDQGIAENDFLVSEGQNKVEVAINTGGSNYLSVSRIIQGVLGQYNLVIESNSPASITGSGIYTYGQYINLVAPTVVPMSGVLGVLGGKYIFSKWSGAIESSNNEEILQITGLQSIITVRAEYTQDFMMVIVAGLLIGAACIGGGVIYYKKFRKMKPGPDEDSESVVGSAETDAVTTTTQEEALTQDLKPKEAGASETPQAPEAPKLTAAQIKAEIVKSKGISNYDPHRSANVIKKVQSEEKSVPTPQTESEPTLDEKLTDANVSDKALEGPIIPPPEDTQKRLTEAIKEVNDLPDSAVPLDNIEAVPLSNEEASPSV